MSTAHYPSTTGVEGLYRAHRGDIYRFLARELGNAADAEDATQTVFVNAHRSLVRGCVPAAPRAWLYAIARNVARRTWRDRCECPTAELDLESITDDDTTSDLRRELVDALEALPERQREALVLHELGGLEYAEIACATNQTVAGVETAIFRARRACRAELAGDGALDHTAASKLLARFVAGKLTRQEREALQKHIAVCPDCDAEERERRASRRRRGLLGWLLSLPEAVQRASAFLAGPSPQGLATIVAAVAATGGAATLPLLVDDTPKPRGVGPAVERPAPVESAGARDSRPAVASPVASRRPAARPAASRLPRTGSATSGVAPEATSKRGTAPASSRTEGRTSPAPQSSPAPALTPTRDPELDPPDVATPAPRTAPVAAPPVSVGQTVGGAVGTVEDNVEETVGAVTDTVTTVVEQTPVVGPVVDTVTGPAATPLDALPPLPPLLPTTGQSG